MAFLERCSIFSRRDGSRHPYRRRQPPWLRLQQEGTNDAGRDSLRAQLSARQAALARPGHHGGGRRSLTPASLFF